MNNKVYHFESKELNNLLEEFFIWCQQNSILNAISPEIIKSHAQQHCEKFMESKLHDFNWCKTIYQCDCEE